MYFVSGSRAVLSSNDAWVTDVSLLQLGRVPPLFIEPFIEIYCATYSVMGRISPEGGNIPKLQGRSNVVFISRRRDVGN